MKKITIAIDGYSACGKSTTAKQVARKLGYIHIDSGAMYRAVSLYFLLNDVNLEADENSILEVLGKIKLQFRIIEGSLVLFMNDKDVSAEIRKSDVSGIVSEVSTIRIVRQEMVKQQRLMAGDGGVVMDGRDIGTVVFPNAELKVFMTATLEKRIERRLAQDAKNGIESSEEEIKRNILHRDRIDTSRKESPLKQAKDAILIDNTNLTEEEQVGLVIRYANKIVDRKFAGNDQS